MHLFIPASGASPSEHVWYARPDQILKAAAALHSKAQATGRFLVEGEVLPIQILTKYLCFDLGLLLYYVMDEHHGNAFL